MFGFVKADKTRRKLGGEVFQEKKRRINLFFIVLGILTFLLFNVILYSLSTI
jgi:phage shock protein PspC (stress-responsive transcriptional regulator)